MPDDNGLLAHFAPYLNIGREDVATEALAYILSRSDAARHAFADFLVAGESDAPAIAEVTTQHRLPDGAIPDMVCLDDSDEVLAFVESKFWAPLTRRQPVCYWKALPVAASSILLFIAPPYRVNESSLWDDLVRRLQDKGYQLGETRQEQNLISVPEQDGPRRLMLCSWGLLLDRLAQGVGNRDSQASFEIAQLRGLADSVIAGADPQRDGNTKNLINGVVDRLVQLGWANTDGFREGRPLPDAEGRYLHFARAFAWFGISYAERRRRNRPLWLVFSDSFGSQSRIDVTTDQVRHRLDAAASVDYEMLHGYLCVPIDWPQGDTDDDMLDALVKHIEDIASKICDCPPYRKDASND